MFRPAGILIICLALGLAGCAETPPNPPTQPPVPIHVPEPPPVVASPPPSATMVPTNPPPPIPKPAPLSAPTNPPPVKLVAVVPLVPPVNQVTNLNRPPVQINQPPAVPFKPAFTWTSLNAWAERHRLSLPRRIANSPLVTYALGNSQGRMVLEIGSRDAAWNGTLLHLGFAPEMVDDQIFVHELDLEKNLAPLLTTGMEPAAPKRVIVLDPGHGGVQGGTISVLSDHRPEKEFTLDWAKRLANLLAHRGWEVVLTRTNDGDIEVTNRVNFANAHHASLFISLHFNSAFPDQKQSGLETYCLTPTGMPSFITRGYPDLTYLNFPANAYDAESLRLAMKLHRSILRATGEEDRGVRRARFLGVLRGQHCPCVLIEGGYLSNPKEARLIENPEYRQQLAEAVAVALNE